MSGCIIWGTRQYGHEVTYARRNRSYEQHCDNDKTKKVGEELSTRGVNKAAGL